MWCSNLPYCYYISHSTIVPLTILLLQCGIPLFLPVSHTTIIECGIPLVLSLPAYTYTCTYTYIIHIMISLEQWRAAIGCFSHRSPLVHYIHPYTQRGVYNIHISALLYHIRTVFCILYAYAIVQYVLLCYIVKMFIILAYTYMFPDNTMLLNTCIHNLFLHYSVMCCQYINMLFHYTIIYCRYLIMLACFVQLFCSVRMLVRYVTVHSSDIRKLKNNYSTYFEHKYTTISVHAYCQSSTMIVHCFLYASIVIQLL